MDFQHQPAAASAVGPASAHHPPHPHNPHNPHNPHHPHHPQLVAAFPAVAATHNPASPFHGHNPSSNNNNPAGPHAAALHQQHALPHWNGAFPPGSHPQSPSLIGGGAAFPPGSQPPRGLYTSAPPAQGVPASTHQQPQPQTFHGVSQQSPGGSNSSTPSHQFPPYGFNPNQPPHPQQHNRSSSISSTTQQPGQNSVMASPVAPAVQSPSTPRSPLPNSRDQERVAILLQINTELLREASSLHSQGKGGMMGQQKTEDGKDTAQPSSREWIDCMRRIQSNLAWLTDEAQRRNHSSPGPAFMDAPAYTSALTDLYSKLQGVFPGWKGQVMVRPSAPSPGSAQGPPATTVA